MTLRCREGDLALVINEEPGCDPNIGRAVTLHAPLVVCETRGASWTIEPVVPEPWFAIEVDGEPPWVGTITRKDGIYHPDAWLLPLRPEPKSGECTGELEDHRLGVLVRA
jgi:hypothetical protein